MTDDDILTLFGALEDDERDPERMVVRVCGHRIGTAKGWIDIGGFTVLMPQFKREPGLLKYMPDQDIPDKTGVLLDYYLGLIAIVEEPEEKVELITELKLVWWTNIRATRRDDE